MEIKIEPGSVGSGGSAIRGRPTWWARPGRARGRRGVHDVSPPQGPVAL